MEKLLLERQTDFDARVLLTSVDEAAKLLLDTKAKLEEQTPTGEVKLNASC